MPYALNIKEEARLDLLEAYQYYEQEQIGLGDRFLLEIHDRLSDISQAPENYSYIDNRKILRDVLLKSFPYVIVYEFFNAEVTVFAFYSTYRRPSHLQGKS